MTDEKIETEMDALTEEMLNLCSGKTAGSAIGAAINVVRTVLDYVPDGPLLAGLAYIFRQQAERIEAQIKGVTH